MSNVYNDWLPETIILFPLFTDEFWVSAIHHIAKWNKLGSLAEVRDSKERRK